MTASRFPPRERPSWREDWRALSSLVAYGGTAVSTLDPDSRHVVARTLVQLDGDVVSHIVRQADPVVLKDHFLQVHARLRRIRMPLRQLTAALCVAASSAGAITSWRWAQDARWATSSALVSVLIAWFVREHALAIFLKILGWWLRRRLDRKGKIR